MMRKAAQLSRVVARLGYLTRAKKWDIPNRLCTTVTAASSSSSTSPSSTTRTRFSESIKNGPSLVDFMKNGAAASAPQHTSAEPVPDDVVASSATTSYMLHNTDNTGHAKKMFIETYGCQMNVSDSEIVVSIMNQAGYQTTSSLEEADVVLVNTCAIRENAEHRVWARLRQFRSIRKKSRPDMRVGILGCMAERLKDKLLQEDKLVDVVVGPDAYRDLPRLLAQVNEGDQRAMNVQLSLEETYADITPVRVADNQVSAYISVMRGCNNMCSFCIVPFTRGRERSRPVHSIENEVRELSARGYKEIVLLGQNVNSYNDTSTSGEKPEVESPSPSLNTMSRGFRSIYKIKAHGLRFAHLLDRVARVDPEMRIRFTSPHPKDFPDDLLYVIRDYPNICKSLHIPAQSGSSAVLERMRRGYTREAYLDLIDHIRAVLGERVGLSSDFIAGFCGETEEDHRQTVDLLRRVRYDQAFMFAYSLREKTHAHRHYVDDVPKEVKVRRLQEIINTFYDLVEKKNREEIGTYQVVLVEKPSRRSETELFGRTDTNKKVVFPDVPMRPSLRATEDGVVRAQPGDYVLVKIEDATKLTLRGTAVARTTLKEASSQQLSAKIVEWALL